MILKSPAKLNLYLEVINKRKDGFHNISTIFEKIALCDKVSLKKRKKGIKITSSGERIPLGAKNLAYKAARLIQEKTGIKKGIEIGIKKNIPVGAGLGGGSSNAATVLLGLNHLWQLGLSNKKLLELGAKIGSDVPFFISKGVWANGVGRGEVLKPFNSYLKLWHLVVVPKDRISTKASYASLSLSLTKKRLFNRIIIYAIKQKKVRLLEQAIFNRLEESRATAKCSSVKKIKAVFAGLGIKAIMSGSGSSVFAVFAKRKEAFRVRKALSAFPGQVFLVKTWAYAT